MGRLRPAMHTVSHVRRSIRHVENDIRAIDRMVQALDRRFPSKPSSTEFGRLFSGVALHEEWDVVADRGTSKRGMLGSNNRGDGSSWHIGELCRQPFHELGDDRLLTQIDQDPRLASS
jgi:hypothetical protein